MPTEIPGVLFPAQNEALPADGMYFCEGPVWDKRHNQLRSVTLAQMNIEHGAKPTG